MGHRRSFRLAAAVVLLSSLPACIELRRDTVEPPKVRATREVSEFLSTRATRLLQRDIEGYLAGLSQPARAFEQPLASGAASVPLSSIELKLANPGAFDPDDTGSVRVSFLYRYQPLPQDNVFRFPLIYSLKKIGTAWMVESSRGEDEALAPPWMEAQVQTASSEHFLAIFRPGLKDPGRALALAEQARGQLAPKLTLPLEAAHLILLAKDRAEYEQMAARRSPVSAVAQAETSYEVTPQEIKVQSRQMVVNLQKLFDDGSEVETFQHELGHLALASDTRPFTPAWVSESAAMYLADTKPLALWKSGTRRGTFDGLSFEQMSTATQLGQHDPTGEAASYEYAYSAAAAYSLVETFGPAKYWEFYRSYANVPASRFYEGLPSDRIADEDEESVTKLATETTKEALSKVFGLTEGDLDLRVRAWIRRQR